MATNLATHELRPAAGFVTSFRQQAWLLGMSGRWIYLNLGLLGVTVAIALLEGGLKPESLLLITMLVLVAGAIWPVMLWHGEGPRSRSYHWSLPVARPAHDLARIAAGAGYLLAACAVWAAIALAIAYFNGTFELMPPDVLAVLFGPAAWGYFFLSPLIVYLLVSPLALWSDYPATRWLLGGWTALGLLAALLSFKGIHLPARLAGNVLGGDSALGMANAVMTGLHRGLVAADPPGMPDAWGAVALWLAIGAALTVFAARFRPDDLRRIARGLRA